MQSWIRPPLQEPSADPSPAPIEIVPKMVPTRLPRKIFSAVAVISGPREPIMLPKADDEASQQPVVRIPLQISHSRDDADDRDAVAEQHRRPAADDAVERA